MEVQADLSRFGLGPMVRLVAALRESANGCRSLEDFADRTCHLLRQCFVTADGRPQTVLVRFYGTARLEELPAQEQAFVAARSGELPATTACLTLLGTAGERPEWNDRTRSQAHRVLPLVDTAQVAQLPMVAALLEQLGIDVRALVDARSDVVLPHESGEDYRVFHVAQARGSAVIPAQDFVTEHGVASALGFGGALPTGEVYAVVVFSAVPVPLESAQLFGTVALSTSLAVLDLLDLPLLATSEPPAAGRLDHQARSRERQRVTRALLTVHEQVAARADDRATQALEQARFDAARAAALAAVALRLGSVRNVEAVTEVLVRDGVPVLGADGGSLALVEDSGQSVRVDVSSAFNAEVRSKYATLPLDDALPTTLTARTGEVVLVPDRAAGLARFPALAQVYRDVPIEALASLPLRLDGRLLGALTFTWKGPHAFGGAAIELMTALAAQAAQAVGRTRLLERERGQSETLQRSLLTRPPSPWGLEIEVRYLPASEHAQVGGDWYDAFRGPDGATIIAVGDVVGHDMLAAAVMGQVRNLVRGISFSRPGSPAEVLSLLDQAMAGLDIGASATVVLARIEPSRDSDAPGSQRLTWTNAGHPPPLWHGPDGEVHVLETEPDLMMGVSRQASRNDHVLVLEPGSTLLLYTDGLVERRGEDIAEGIERIANRMAGAAGCSLGDLCQDLLSLLDEAPEDDVALVAVRVPPVVTTD